MEPENASEGQKSLQEPPAESDQLEKTTGKEMKKCRVADPDLKVMVGGKEFQHYKIILCMACPFFDTALSMETKEATESRIEFANRNPEEWEIVYSFIQFNGKPPPITRDNALMLLSWFDYLGMSDLAHECDSVYAKSVKPSNSINNQDALKAFFEEWEYCKSLPCPLTHEEILNLLETAWSAEQPFVVGYWDKRIEPDLYGLSEELEKKMLGTIVDGSGGDQIWNKIKSKFPSDVAGRERHEAVKESWFPYLLRDIFKPAKLVIKRS